MSSQWTRRTLFLLFVSIPAQALAGDVEISLEHQFSAGDRLPALVIKANRALQVVHLELKWADGGRLDQRSAAVAAGGGHVFELPLLVGNTRLSGSITYRFESGGSESLDLSFDVEVKPVRSEKLQLDVPENRLRVEEGWLDLRMSDAALRCDYDVRFDRAGAQVGFVRFDGEAAGTWLRIAWDPPPGDVVLLKIRLICSGMGGSKQGIEIFPWWLEIPHEDVTFKSGSSTVPTDELPKLDRAYRAILPAVRRYGKAYAVKLFIAGHTDRVGDAAYNRDLSLKRARSIAEALRLRGVTVPIYFTGFGETELAVTTDDEVDEPRNRRVRYILAMQHPEAVDWHRLE